MTFNFDKKYPIVGHALKTKLFSRTFTKFSDKMYVLEFPDCKILGL